MHRSHAQHMRRQRLAAINHVPLLLSARLNVPLHTPFLHGPLLHELSAVPMPVTAQKPGDVAESQRSALRRAMLVPGLAVLNPRPSVAAP